MPTDERERAVADAITRAAVAIVVAYRETGIPAAAQSGAEADIDAALRGLWHGAAREGSERVQADIERAKAADAASSLPTFDEIVAAFAERFGAAKVVRIVEATRKQMRDLVVKGLAEGLGVEEIARLMMDAIPEIARLRAQVIARTETHQASEFASMEVARRARFAMEKEWLSVQDGRTRDFGESDGVVDSHNHRVMNGTRVPIGMPFMVPTKYGGKEPMMHPGDPNGTAGNVINCRCTVGYRRVRQNGTQNT